MASRLLWRRSIAVRRSPGEYQANTDQEGPAAWTRHSLNTFSRQPDSAPHEKACFLGASLGVSEPWANTLAKTIPVLYEGVKLLIGVKEPAGLAIRPKSDIERGWSGIKEICLDYYCASVIQIR